MREIKFRAWNYETKSFDYFDLKTSKGQCRLCKDYDEMCEGEGTHSDLQLFIGLRDKNGKEIYEGDVIGGENQYVFVVKYNNGCFVAEEINKDATFLISGVTCYGVLGNIYETPELLGGRK